MRANKKNLAHVVSLQVFKERCGGGRKKKKPLRRGGWWVVHNKCKGVSPERSGGHQFCHFLAYTNLRLQSFLAWSASWVILALGSFLAWSASGVILV